MQSPFGAVEQLDSEQQVVVVGFEAHVALAAGDRAASVSGVALAIVRWIALTTNLP